MDSELISILLKLGAVAILVFLNGFFVAAEFGLVKLRDSQLRHLEKKGSRRATHARRVLGNLDASLSACQLGITLASLGLGWIGEPIFADLLAPLLNALEIHNEGLRHSIAFILGFTAITFLHITAGEQAPKMLAIQRPLSTSLWIAQPLLLFHRVSYPFIWVLNAASTWMLRRVGIDIAEDHGSTHTEEEVRVMLSTAHQSQGRSVLGRQIILNAMDLRHRLVREVMRPRNEIVFLDLSKPLEENLKLDHEQEYSRYPICPDGDLDKAVGVIHFRKLIQLSPEKHSEADLKEAAKPIVFIPETARLEHLLEHFLKSKSHYGLVVDEYGGTVGMVTLENVLEELVGQIQDEFDEEVPLVVKRNEHTWDLNGALPLHELEELIGTSLQEEGISTVNGWITVKLGDFPKEGQQIDVEGFRLEVVKIDGHKVEQVTLRRLQD